MAEMGPTSRDEEEAARLSARTHNPDVYVAALLAPRAAAPDLITLAAYAGELQRIPLEVGDPNLALIRLTWWRDRLDAPAAEGASGHPVADAFLSLLRRRQLPLALARQMIDAREAEVSAWDEADETHLATYLDDAGPPPFILAAYILGVRSLTSDQPFLAAAGRGWAATRLARDLPRHAHHGRLPVPHSYIACKTPAGEGEPTPAAMADATRHLAGIAARNLAILREIEGNASREAVAAALPAALIEPYLRALQRRDYDPAPGVGDVSPMGRMVRLWLAAARHRI